MRSIKAVKSGLQEPISIPEERIASPPGFKPPGRGAAMPAKKRKPVLRRPRKTYWHLYSLQNLNSEKFVKVVDKILRNEFHLIK